MNPYVIHLKHRKPAGMWHLEHEGSSIGAYNTKADGIVAGHIHGRRLQEGGTDTRLVAHHEDGSIESEYSYGDDLTMPASMASNG